MTDTTVSEFVITECPDHGVKVCSDRASAIRYVSLARACWDDGSTDAHGHYMAHIAWGHDCWVCCDKCTIDPSDILD